MGNFGNLRIFCVLYESRISALEIIRLGSFCPKNVFSVDTLPSGIQRVLFIPMNSEHVNLQEFAHLKEVFLSELRRSERFSVVEGDPKLQLSKSHKDPSLDLNKLAALADEYDVQAILELKLTHYRAYKPQLLGVNARLFTLIW